MADRPIIFSAPMVRALLDGRKTQTRRLLTPQPFDNGYIEGQITLDAVCRSQSIKEADAARFSAAAVGGHAVREQWVSARFSRGDRLYVREAWQTSDDLDDVKPSKLLRSVTPILYKATGHVVNVPHRTVAFSKTRPGMFMPRWASRLTLTVTDVRVERLQDISEADAIEEGIEPGHNPDTGEVAGWRDYETIHEGRHKGADHPHAIIPYAEAWRSYSSLWGELHTKPSTRWADNPWIVAVTFTVARGNIDGEVDHG